MFQQAATIVFVVLKFFSLFWLADASDLSSVVSVQPGKCVKSLQRSNFSIQVIQDYFLPLYGDCDCGLQCNFWPCENEKSPHACESGSKVDHLVMVFRGGFFDANHIIKKGHAKQLLAYVDFEPPVLSRGRQAAKSAGFDWIVSYHRNADITGSYLNPDFNYSTAVPVATAYVRNPEYFALYLVSDCEAFTNGRRKYFAELSKHITVLSIGTCDNNRGGESIDTLFPECNNAHWQESKKCVVSKFMFYLSFENSISHDYVTEKLFLTFESPTIPVYLGALNAHELVPAHSTIFAKDYISPKHLAHFLTYVAQSDERYNSYFQWKLAPKSALNQKFLHLERFSMRNLGCNICRSLAQYFSNSTMDVNAASK